MRKISISTKYKNNLINKKNCQKKKKRQSLKKNPVRLNFTKFNFQCTSLDNILGIISHQNREERLVETLNTQ